MATREWPRVSTRGSARVVGCVIGLLATAATVGCSSGNPLANLFGSESNGRASETGTFYAASDGLRIYPKPSFSSAPVGKLALHQKVYRSKIDKGFAYVKVAGSGQIGWVENAKLLWRLPSSRKTATGPVEESPEEAVAEPAAEPISAEADVEQEPAAATESSPGKPADEPGGADPSLFNPF